MGVHKIGEVVTQLKRRQHTLVDNNTRRQRNDIEIFLANYRRFGNFLLNAAAQYVEFRFDILIGAFVGNEDLLYGRFGSFRHPSKQFIICGNVAHGEHGKAKLEGFALENVED